MARIALLEDDPVQAKVVSLWLEQAGHSCHVFDNGRSLVKSAAHESFDLFILDWRTPEMSGEQVLTWVRKNIHDPVPILFTTMMDREEDIVHALTQGADDYLVKPLREQELLARIQVLLRRGRKDADADATFSVGSFLIDPQQRRISRDGTPIELTDREFELALLLFRNVGRLFSRSHIMDAVWGHGEDLVTRRIDTHMSRLRTKLGLGPDAAYRLVAIHQHGYRLESADPAPR